MGRPNAKMKITLRLTILMALAGLVVLSSAILITISIYYGRKSVENILGSLIRQASTATVEKTTSYLAPADEVARMISLSLGLGLESRPGVQADASRIAAEALSHLDDPTLATGGLTRAEATDMLRAAILRNDGFVRMSRGVLPMFKEISKVHLSEVTRQEFVMVKKMTDHTLSVTYRLHYTAPRGPSAGQDLLLTIWSHDNPVWYSKTGDWSSTIKPGSEYRPSERPWYRKAVAEHQESRKANRPMVPRFTDPYVFYVDRTTGVSCSIPILGNGGEPSHILCVDIGLFELSSEYLAGLRASPKSRTFLVTRNGDLLAYPIAADDENAEKFKRLITEVTNESGTRIFNLAKVGEFDGPLLKEAWETRATGKEGETTTHRFSIRGIPFRAVISPLDIMTDLKWNSVLVLPEDDFLALTKRNTNWQIFISIGILVLTILLSIYLSANITRGLRELMAEAERIRVFDLSNQPRLASPLVEIDRLGEGFFNMRTGLRSFGKYVPIDVVRSLLAMGQEAEVGGQTRTITLFFSDIAGFTHISEGLTPNQLVMDLGEYMSAMGETISTEKGTIDKFIGDAVMAFWNAPLPAPDHAILAVTAALRCQARLKELREGPWKQEGRALFAARIGLHTGDAVVGNMGSRARLNYTAIGDAVNLASRTEGLNKYYGTSILVTGSTWEQTRGRFAGRKIDRAIVSGREEPVDLWEPWCPVDHRTDRHTQLGTRWDEAMALYQNRDFDLAHRSFESIAADFDRDPPALTLAARCAELLRNPPSGDWNGVWVFSDK